MAASRITYHSYILELTILHSPNLLISFPSLASLSLEGGFVCLFVLYMCVFIGEKELRFDSIVTVRYMIKEGENLTVFLVSTHIPCHYISATNKV